MTKEIKALGPGQQVVIEGVGGKVELTRWHVGDDFRIIFDGGANTMYFATDGVGVRQFLEGLAVRDDGDTSRFEAGRARADIFAASDRVNIRAYDVMSMGFGVNVTLDRDQCNEIVARLSCWRGR